MAELSIIDQVAPHTRFHVGADVMHKGVRYTCVQLLDRENLAILDAHVFNGKVVDDEYFMIERLEPHRDYFRDLVERYVTTVKPPQTT